METLAPPLRRRVLTRWLRRVRRRLRRFSRQSRTRALLDLVALSRGHELSTPELWSAWTLANLECEIELKAWSVGTRPQRHRAYRRYVHALAREAQVADLLAARCV